MSGQVCVEVNSGPRFYKACSEGQSRPLVVIKSYNVDSRNIGDWA